MKIQIVSDLHHEFGISDLNPDGIDLLVIAGDLDLGIKGISWIIANIKDIPVIYVLGNHEYYKGNYPGTLYKIKEYAIGSNVHVLENESVVIGHITFHGATLWTDFRLFGNPETYGSICQQAMSDYRLIRLNPGYSKLRSIDTYRIHFESYRWLENSLKTSQTDLNIVVTHHAPSIISIPEEFKEDPVSSAYASDLEALICQYQPDYWIHGHIHHPVDYVLGNTRIICNPRGYIHEKYNGYNPESVIEVNAR